MGAVSTFVPLMIFVVAGFNTPFLTIIYFLVLFLVFTYLLARISFAGFGVIIGKLGPLQAIKHSWQITKGRVAEVIGTLAVTFSIAFVLSFVLNMINIFLVGLEVSTVTLISLAVFFVGSVAVTLISLAPIAKRYNQFSQVPNLSDHKTSWGSIVGAIALAIGIIVAISALQAAQMPSEPETTATTEQDLQDIYNQYKSQPTDVEYDSTLQDFLNDSGELPVSDEL
jgi:membrane-anchored glycerophosphoryl diester phosphodiesterase (GDPDase)